MKAIKKVCLILMLITVSGFAQGAVYSFKSAGGKVTFLAKGKPAFISIEGVGQGVLGQLTEKEGLVSGDLTFALNSLSTGIALRDEHMKSKYLEVQIFPEATLKLTSLKVPMAGQRFPFSGRLALHGKEQGIEGEATLTESAGEWSLAAQFPIKLSHFSIAIPSFKGITVAEDVQVKVDVPVKRLE